MVKAHLKSLKEAYKNTYFIADAALYVEETIKSLSEQGQLFITRVPQKIKEAKVLLSKANTLIWTPLNEGYSGSWYESFYGGIPQRWLLIRSTQAKAREKHILDKYVFKKTQGSIKSFKKLCRESFSCEADANSALQKWQKAQEFVRIEEAKIIQKINRTRRGLPGLRDDSMTTFHIAGHIASCLKLKEEAMDTTGLFILATNDLSEQLSM